MKKLKIKQWGIFILSSVGWLFLDLTSKAYVIGEHFKPIILIRNFLYFSLQTNKGIAFGILLGYAFQLIASVFILGFLIYFGFKYISEEKRNAFLNQFLLGIIVGGAIGNLVNRIQFGYVIDFIVLKPFPVFNIADIGITLGLILLFITTTKK